MDINKQAEAWVYYQNLVKTHGFDGITDLLVKYDAQCAESSRYRKALERIRDEIPPNEHKKWHHHHHYYFIANSALALAEGSVYKAALLQIRDSHDMPNYALRAIADRVLASAQQERPGLGTYSDGMVKLGYRSGSSSDPDQSVQGPATTTTTTACGKCGEEMWPHKECMYCD